MSTMSEIELSTKSKDAENSGVADDVGDGNSDSDGGSDKEGLALLQTSLDEFDEQLEAGVVPSSKDASLQTARARPTTAFGKVCRLWRKHLLGPEDHRGWTIRRCCNKNNGDSNDERLVTLLDASGLKLFKFFVVTIACLVAVHVYASIAGDKRDTTYDLQKMLVYDGKPIATDVMVFFLVGRLYESSNTHIDTLSFVVPLLGTALLQSWGATHLQSLQHSITPYELKCEWTWQMYLLVMGGCLPLLGGLLVAHCREVYRRGAGLKNFVEFVATGVLFLLPYGVSDGRFFHLHHWYYAWFWGMHCNLHGNWWSELAMSILWGIYINGVAIFGRDPVLTCAQTLYQSQSQECEYLPPELAFGQYTLDDLARDSGKVFDEVLDDTGGPIVCASDVTRWLFGA